VSDACTPATLQNCILAETIHAQLPEHIHTARQKGRDLLRHSPLDTWVSADWPRKEQRVGRKAGIAPAAGRIRHDRRWVRCPVSLLAWVAGIARWGPSQFPTATWTNSGKLAPGPDFAVAPLTH